MADLMKLCAKNFDDIDKFRTLSIKRESVKVRQKNCVFVFERIV